MKAKIFLAIFLISAVAEASFDTVIGVREVEFETHECSGAILNSDVLWACYKIVNGHELVFLTTISGSHPVYKILAKTQVEPGIFDLKVELVASLSPLGHPLGKWGIYPPGEYFKYYDDARLRIEFHPKNPGVVKSLYGSLAHGTVNQLFFLLDFKYCEKSLAKDNPFAKPRR